MLSPTVNVRVLSSSTNLEGFLLLVTVMTQDLDFLLLLVEVALMVTLPAFLKVTLPLEDTVATALLLVVHLTDWLADLGATTALS